MKTDEDLVIDEEVVVDDTQEEEIVEQSDVSEESEPETVPEEDEEEDRIITIGDAPAEGEADEDAHQETPGWVKKVRKVNRKLEGENKRLKRQLEEAAKPAEKPVELGTKPTLASCKYDDSKYETELISFYEKKRVVEQQASEKAKVVEQQNKSWQERQEHYVELKKEHSFKDFEETEETVSATFSPTQQALIVEGADDAALLVYALGKNPKKLEELAKITNNVKFIFAVSKLESQLKVTSKKAPSPEKRVSSGKAGGITGNTDKTLDRLRDEAAKTGDYTKVTAYKNKLRKG